MRKLLALSSLVLVVACGGGGGGTVGAPTPFTGSWAGTWNSQSLGQSGNMSLVVANDGHVTGQSSNTTTGLSGGVIEAQVDPSGNFSGTSTYPGQQSTGLRGSLALTDSTHMDAQVIQTINGTDYAGTAALVKQ